MTGSWDKLADKLDLSRLDSKSFLRKQAVTNVDLKWANKQALESNAIELPKSAKWVGGGWRGISQKTLRKIGARVNLESKRKELILPVMVRGELVSYIRAALKKTKFAASYLTAENSHLKGKGLFPFDSVPKMLKKTTHLVIVEGPRDALRLIDCDIPAVAILGTNSWSATKRNLVLSLCAEYEAEPLVMLDSDEPGQKAQKTLVKELKPHSNVAQVNLSLVSNGVKMDPANMPEKLVSKLRRKMRR